MAGGGLINFVLAIDHYVVIFFAISLVSMILRNREVLHEVAVSLFILKRSSSFMKLTLLGFHIIVEEDDPSVFNTLMMILK